MSEIVNFPAMDLRFELPKVAFSVFGFDIYWYAALIAVGVVLAFIYTIVKSKKYGVNTERFIDVVLFGMVGSIVFARLYYVVFNWDVYKHNPEKIFSIRDGGIAIYGAIIGAFLVGTIFAKIYKTKISPMMDLAALGFLIGQTIGRWGNFFNVEAFGVNTTLPWGMHSESIQKYLTQNQEYFTNIGISVDPSLPVHPTFLYESLWCLLGFVILHLYSKRRKFDGEIFIFYIGWYSFGRFFIEGLRTDSLMFGGFRVSQILAAILFIIAIAVWVYLKVRIKKKYKDGYVLYVNTEEGKLSVTGELYIKNKDLKSQPVVKDNQIKHNEKGELEVDFSNNTVNVNNGTIDDNTKDTK